HFAPDALARQVLPRRHLFRFNFLPVAFELLGDQLDEPSDGALSHLRPGDADDAGVIWLDEYPGIYFSALIAALRHGGAEAGRQIESQAETTAGGGGTDDELAALKLCGFSADGLVHRRPP